MSYIRRKSISLDGAEFVLSPLSFRQVSEISAELDESEKAEAATLLHPSGFWMYRLICRSLNRAGASPEWTAARIESDLDPELVQWLYKQTMDVSGLKLEERKPGEIPAAAPVSQ